ncbi:MAG TPA: integration host factor subunit alpha [Gammaproteobacteria bacterium]|jgi:integration host factor subunit alpha|nr:integration host factor subunit alpha [Gammaproteobacteria bacterium]|tara:strand:+ start:133 stop:432 length:300 start_codon:yes stop_codon:yes gene_type:complete
MTLTKSDIVKQLNDEIGLNKREAKELVDSFFDNIKETLSQGHEVKLSGFGNFQLKNKSSRPGRNPRTGEDVEITARRVVTFKSGQKLKESVKTLTHESD